MLMLRWSSHCYEGKCKEFVAEVANIKFKKPSHDLILRYLLVEQELGGFILYLECNSELFTVAHYNNIKIAFKKADQHFNTSLLAIFKG